MQNLTLVSLSIASLFGTSPFMALNQKSRTKNSLIYNSHFSQSYSNILYINDKHHRTVIDNCIFSRMLNVPLVFSSYYCYSGTRCCVSIDYDFKINQTIENLILTPDSFPPEFLNKNVFFEGNMCGDIKIFRCQFIECSAKYSTVSGSEDAGGGIRVQQDCEVLMHQCAFSDCHSYQDGGAIAIAATIKFDIFISSDEITNRVPTHKLARKVDIQYSCFQRCYLKKEGFGPVMIIGSEDFLFNYSYIIDCPNASNPIAFGAQCDLLVNSTKSAFINSTRGRSLYCTSIEYRQTIDGYFKYHNLADNYGKYIVAFTIKSSDDIDITSCNFINNSVRHAPGETINDVKPALIFANDCDLFITNFYFIGNRLFDGKIATQNIDSEKSFYIIFEDCYVDFPNSSIFEYDDISFTNCIFDESIEETYPNNFLQIEDCLDQFIKDFLYKTSTFTPTYQFGQTYRFTPSQTFTNSDKFPSSAFSNSEVFSQTDLFSSSEIFSRSDVFLKTNDFSLSSDFSRSLLFSNTEQFSFSVDFTISNKFNDSDHFSKSNYFGDSELFTSSCIFSKTESFTPKPSIPPTLYFSQSLMFSHSSVFSYSFQFSQSSDFTSIPTQSIYGHMISKQISYVESFVMVKSVSFSNSYIVSNVLSITFNSELGQYSYILSQTNVYAMLPYVIQIFSPTIIQTMMMFELSQPKKQITAEQLIGIVCGSIAAFFCVLGTVILFLRRKQKTVYSDDLDYSTDDEVVTTKTHETEVNLQIENINNVDLDQWL